MDIQFKTDSWLNKKGGTILPLLLQYTVYQTFTLVLSPLKSLVKSKDIQ